MNSKELFESSKPKEKPKIQINTLGLPIRVYNSLYREFEKLGLPFDKYSILNVVLDHRIWYMRNIGPVSVKQVCDWLAPQLDDDLVFKEK